MDNDTALIPDPANRPPLCDEPEFAALLESMVAGCAPRLFAVVQEYGERVDARIAAWGMAFEDEAKVVSLKGGTYLSLESPDFAVQMFAMGDRGHARLIWATPPPVDGNPRGER